MKFHDYAYLFWVHLIQPIDSLHDPLNTTSDQEITL